MAFVLQDNSYRQLSDPKRLNGILSSLKKGIGGFVDIGVVDAAGHLTAYAGPYRQQGVNLCNEPCFKQVVERGALSAALKSTDTSRPVRS